jgi:hypothetical protein
MALKCYGVTSSWRFVLLRRCFSTSVSLLAFLRLELSSTIPIRIQISIEGSFHHAFDCRKIFIRIQPAAMFHLWKLYFLHKCHRFRLRSLSDLDHRHLQRWSFLACSFLRYDETMRVMNNSFFLLQQVTSLWQNILSWRGQSFIRCLFSFRQVAYEFCLPSTSTWEGALSSHYPPGQWDLQLLLGRVATPCRCDRLLWDFQSLYFTP